MALSAVLILVGIILLVVGGEVLLRGAVGLATLLRMTPAVIGLTVVAAGTSVPELAVSAIAAWKESPDIAVGNVVGSNIFNIAFILGFCALVRPLAITGNTIRLEYPVMALATGMFLVFCQDGVIGRPEAGLFLAFYVAFTAYLVWLVRRQMNEQELQEYRTEVKELTPTSDTRPRFWVCALLIAGGVALLGGGAQATVMGAVELARLLGLSERVIGLTIVAGGTGLPEVVTSLVSSVRGRDDVAIGNVIGSNLFNILGTLGLSGLILPLPIAAEIIARDSWWLLAITLLLFPLMFTSRRIVRWEGLLLLAVYAAYLVSVLAQSV